jgi:hypothetical protein
VKKVGCFSSSNKLQKLRHLLSGSIRTTTVFAVTDLFVLWIFMEKVWDCEAKDFTVGWISF